MESTKYLDMTIDRHIKWDKYVTRLTNKIQRLISKFYILRHILSKKVLRMVYKALVKSITRLDNIQTLRQHFILKVIFAHLYSEDISNVRTIYIYSVCLFVYDKQSTIETINPPILRHNSNSSINFF